MDLEEKLITLKVESSATIKTIKDKIQELSGSSVTDRVIMLKGKLLQNDCILSECDINSSKLNVKLKIGKKPYYL